MTVAILHNAKFYGGGERHTSGLALALAEMGVRVKVLDCGDGIYSRLGISHPRVTVTPLPVLGDTRNPLECWKALRDHPANLAVVITGGLEGFNLAAEMGIAARYPRVIRLEHGCADAIESYKRRRWFGVIPGLNLMANLARARRLLQTTLIPKTVAVSHASKRRLIRHCYARGANIRVVHNGTDCAVTAPRSRKEVRAELGVGDTELLFVSCGRLSHEKGVDVAIRAFPEYAAGRLDAGRLLVLGTGPLEGRLKALAVELGVARHVLFAGFQQDVASYLNASDCLVLSSLTESFPLSVLEGLHFGCHPIVSDVGGVAEMFGPGVPHRLVKPGDVGQLRDALEAFGATPVAERAAQKRLLVEHVARHFDRDKQYDLLLQVITRAAAGGRPRRFVPREN